MKKKCLLLLFVVIFTLVFNEVKSVNAFDSITQCDVYEMSDNSNYSAEFINNQDNANMMYTVFFNQLFLEQKKYGEKCEGYTVNCVSKEFIPAYFGGAYINKYGNLVFEIVEDYMEPNYKDSLFYQNIVSMVKEVSDVFEVRFVKHSYSELMKGMEILQIYMMEKESNIESIGINDYKNAIDIYVSGANNHALEKELKALLNGTPCIIHNDSDELVDEIGLYPGEGVEGSLGSFSVAFPVSLVENGTVVHGFLTTGHSFLNLSSDNVYVNNTIIGTFSNSYYSYGGNSDVALIRTNSNVSIYHSLWLLTGSIRSGYYKNLAQGSQVFMNGKNTHGSMGYVINSTYSGTSNGVLFSDLVSTSYSHSSGDSGGLVYDTPNANGLSYAVGIHKGSGGSLSNGVYTKAGNALNSLGVSVY